MRFQKALHWADGLFLRQQHLQTMQNFLMARDRQTRSMIFPFPCGLFSLEIDEEALTNHRLSLKSVSAVMPDGYEVSMPGNTLVPPLDLANLQNVTAPVTVYLSLPCYSPHGGNLCSSQSVQERRIYMADEVMVNDEYTGEQEVALIENRLNAQLTTDQQNNTELTLLPILRLKPQGKAVADTALEIDRNFIPPYFLLSATHPLFSRLQELRMLLENRRDRIISDLTEWRYSADNFSGESGQLVMQLAILNKYVGRFRSLFVPDRITPFDCYLELRSLLGELAALQPLRNFDSLSEYDHFDSAKAFNELIVSLRSLLLADGESVYAQLEFHQLPEEDLFAVEIPPEYMQRNCDFYLAVHCSQNPRNVIASIEKGDNFRLIAPKFKDKRVRGIKLTEDRYPPRYFPALADTLWFRLDCQNSSAVWDELSKSRELLVDWSRTVFPELKLTLFAVAKQLAEEEK